MSRTRKRLLIAGLGLLGLIAAVLMVGIQVVKTDWFRAYVKQKIIAATEDATGGKVELGSFDFDWKHLRIIVTDFVIHGTEPKDAAPLLRVPRLEVDIRPFTSIHHIIDVTYLGVDRPEANIMILADGRNNLPRPKPSTSSGQPPLQSIVNAAIGHFDLNQATIAFADARQTLSLHANNFRAQLWFNVLQQSYRGKLDFQPIYVAAGRNTPVAVNITLPVSIEKDSVGLDGATVATARSSLRISGSVDNLRNPKITARVLGQIALTDLKDLGDLPLTLGTRGMPVAIDVDADASVSSESIQVAQLQLKLGASSVDASGTLKDSQGRSGLRFDTQIALGEIGRLLNLEQNPLGTVALKGTAKLDAADNYDVTGDLTAQKVSLEQGGRRIGNLDLISAVHLDPHTIALNKLRVNALGGTLEGDASLEDLARYTFRGELNNFTLQSVTSVAGEANLPYSGSIQGPITASGDIKAPNSLNARIALAIAPGKTGIPVSGRLNVSYEMSSNDVQVNNNSYITFPHSRLTVDGAALRQLNVALTTTDLSDFLPVIGSRNLGVNLQGHRAEFTGTVSGGLSSPYVAGHLRANGFAMEGRMFDSLAVDATASGNGAAVQQGMITRGPMQIEFTGRVGMNQWKITPRAPIDVQATVQNSDLADVMALAGQPATDTSGAFEARVEVSGTAGDPTGSATFTASNGMVRGEPFNRVQAQVNLTDQLIAIPSATVDRGSSHIAVAAEYHHSRDSLSSGQLHARVQGNQVDLAQIQELQRLRPGAGGTLELTADVTGDVTAGAGSPKFQLVNATANVSARGLQFDQQNFGDATIDARSAGQTVRYQLVSSFAGSNIRVTGNTDLQQDYKTSLDANISNLPIERALAAARRTDIPAKGTLSATVHVSGTKDEPTGSIDLNLTKAVLYQEPVDRLQVKASYETQRAVLEQFEIAAPGAQLAMTGEFDHPKDNLQAGQIRFHLSDSRVDLARVPAIQASRPGLSGIVQMGGDGTAELRASVPRVSFTTLKANIAANQISEKGKNLGNATLNADTQNNNVTFTLTSNLAGASIRGTGRAQMTAEYPVDAQLSFSNVNWANLQPLFGSPANGDSSFNAGADGEVTVHGTVLKADQLSGSLRLNRVELSSAATKQAATKQVVIKNAEPVSVTLDAGNLRIDSAHFTGPQTDIQAKGSLSLKDRSMNLNLNANANLGVLQTLDRDFSSSGNLTLAATVRGTVAKPALNGTVQLKNASVNYTQFPNGISNANGTVEFNGTTASLRNLTAETGGGKLTLSGFLVLSDSPRFGLRASASSVRIDVQQGVSIVTNANLNLTGTKAASTLSGNAVIARVNYSSRTDLGSILARAAPPVQGSLAPSMLDNMKLDVQITTSDALAVQSALAQGLEGTANLRVQGTASHPSVLGRATMTSGTLTFFGNSYTVNSGTISFFNPVRIEPILDASLETNAEGVDVTLHVTGPIDNLQLSYTSDPPLQFEEIIALLATGKTPTTDPTLLANNPPAQQGVSQMGESAVMSQAIANPVASSMQRVFGVTQLKINPEFTNGSSTPQTTLSLQQQVARNVTFTYITQVDNANAETIRAEITLNPEWSAAAMRDENGIFSINLFYKRQFR